MSKNKTNLLVVLINVANKYGLSPNENENDSDCGALILFLAAV